MASEIQAQVNLVSACLTQSLARPTGLAVSAAGRRLCYGELTVLAGRTAAWLCSGTVRPARVGVLAGRSIESCAGLLAAAWAGAAFVPLSPSWPAAVLLERVCGDALDALIVDRAGAAQLSPTLLAAAPQRVLALHTARARRSAPADLPPRVETRLPSEDRIDAPAGVDPAAPACLIHGDTRAVPGVPAVVLPVGSVQHFLGVAGRRYGISPEDRLAHGSDVARGGCLFSVFAALGAGASLHIATASHLKGSVGFVQEEAVTVWAACGGWTGDRGAALLQSGSLPTLRLSLFAGQHLTSAELEAWHRAAPHSVMEALNGPAEAGLASFVQHVAGPGMSFQVPLDNFLGHPLDGTAAAVVDAEGELLPAGRSGELAFFGPQLACGYFAAPALTTERFPVLGGRRCFRSGIYARQDGGGAFHAVCRGAVA